MVSETKTKVRFLTVSRQRYLRNDLGSVLHGSIASGHPGNSDHVLLPDCPFACDYVEFIEGSDVELLLLGSVLDAMRTGARSNREYARLRNCIAKPTRQMSVFYNQVRTTSLITWLLNL